MDLCLHLNGVVDVRTVLLSTVSLRTFACWRLRFEGEARVRSASLDPGLARGGLGVTIPSQLYSLSTLTSISTCQRPTMCEIKYIHRMDVVWPKLRRYEAILQDVVVTDEHQCRLPRFDS